MWNTYTVDLGITFCVFFDNNFTTISEYKQNNMSLLSNSIFSFILILISDMKQEYKKKPAQL